MSFCDCEKNNSVVSLRAGLVSPSQTLAITAKVKKMKAEGVSIIGFGAGEPDFNTPDYIIEAAKTALDKGMTKYTPSSGTAELKAAITAKLKADNGLTYKPEQIVVSNGAKHSLFNAIYALCGEGDEVIIPAPYWLTYPELVKLSGAKPVFVETKAENGFRMTAEELKSAITPRTKALILNSPSNPTGSVYAREELQAIADVVASYENLFVISDEIYEKLVYDGAEHVSIASLGDKIYERVVVVNGMSKAYAMTGWRIGYAAGPAVVIKAIDAMQSHTTSNPNSIAQYASAIALSDRRGAEYMSEMAATFDERRKYMVKALGEIEGVSVVVPKGAFYVLANVSKLFGRKWGEEVITSAMDFADKCVSAGFSVIPGEPFGAPDYVRLSYAISLDDIKEGIARMRKFAEGLKA